jgi:hypothetical protein
MRRSEAVKLLCSALLHALKYQVVSRMRRSEAVNSSYCPPTSSGCRRRLTTHPSAKLESRARSEVPQIEQHHLLETAADAPMDVADGMGAAADRAAPASPAAAAPSAAEEGGEGGEEEAVPPSSPVDWGAAAVLLDWA